MDPQAVGETAVAAAENDDSDNGENGDDGNEPTDTNEGGQATVQEDDRAVAFEPAHVISPLQPLEPHPTPLEPIQPEPPRDEPTPAAPADHADPGPPDR